MHFYCDNYLEGFHIPFVHQDLNDTLDYGDYKTEIYDYCNLQIGYAKDDVEVFDLPEGHPDFGKKVAAYFYWIFPNMMFNFYPLSVPTNGQSEYFSQSNRTRFRNQQCKRSAAGGTTRVVLLLNTQPRKEHCEFVVCGSSTPRLIEI